LGITVLDRASAEGVETGEVGASDSALTLVLRPILKLDGGAKPVGVVSPVPSTSSLSAKLLLREGGSTDTEGFANGFELANGILVSVVDEEEYEGKFEFADRDEDALLAKANEAEGTEPEVGTEKEDFPVEVAIVTLRSSRSLL